MMNALVKRTCMRDRIRDVLVARILEGTYPPGMQLKELPLAREFNVSQAPIREALRELEGTGLVTCERYRGTRVRGADLSEMRESYELRGMIEARAMERAMPLSETVFQRLEQCLALMRSSAGRGDSIGYMDAALGFHRVLVEAGGNATFLKTWDALHWDVRGRVVLKRMFERGDTLSPVLDMHAELIARLRAADLPGATSLVERLFTHVLNVFSEDVPAAG